MNQNATDEGSPLKNRRLIAGKVRALVRRVYRIQDALDVLTIDEDSRWAHAPLLDRAWWSLTEAAQCLEAAADEATTWMTTEENT